MMKKNKNKIVLALCVWAAALCVFAASDCGAADIITTIAGTGAATSTGDGGPSTAATLNAPYGVFQDSSGNIYIAELDGNRVRKIDTSGIITTVAGTGAATTTGNGGPATAATLNKPLGLNMDTSGNLLISENSGNVVRKVNTSGIISTLPVAAGLNGPFQLSWDSSGNLLIADCNNSRVLKVNSSTGATVSTIATTYAPRGVWGDSSGNIFIGEYTAPNPYIVMRNSSGTTTTVAGTGSEGFSGDGGLATSATMKHPYMVSADASGNIFFADVHNNRIRKFTVGGNIYTVAGGGGSFADGVVPTATSLDIPTAVYPTSSGNLLIADSANHRIRLVFPAPAEPATPATAANFTSLDTTSMTVNWINGNGSKRIVLMKQGSAVNSDPVDYTGYAANSVFSVAPASQIGTGNYVVYRGTGSSVTVTGLTSNTVYHVAVYEFNDAGDFGTENFLITTPAIGSKSTLIAEPGTPATALTFPVKNCSSINLNWVNGTGTNRIVLAKAGSAVDSPPADGTTYTANAAFGVGTQIGTGNFVVYNGAGAVGPATTNLTVTGLAAGTAYHFAVYEFNGAGGAENYLTTIPPATGSEATVSATLATEPTVQTRDASHTVAGTSMTITWAIGNGANRILLLKAGGAVDSPPVDGTPYTANAAIGGTQTQIGTGNYVMYYGAGNSVTVTGLTAGIAYYYAIYEANGGNCVTTPNYNYLTANPATGRGGIPAAKPTTPASPPAGGGGASGVSGYSMTLSWTNGGGAARLVLMKAGGSVDSDPVDGTTYTANSVFGQGSQIGTGNYAVYKGTGSSVTVSGLTPLTQYCYAVYEFNGAEGVEGYLTASKLTGCQTTVSGVSVTLNSVGNITGSTVFATGTAIGAGIGERGFYWWIPPTTATHFGGSESGLLPEGNYGAGTFSLTVTGLKPGNTYHLKAYIRFGGQIITSDEQLFTTPTTGPTGKTSPTVSTTSCTLNADGTVTAAGQITDIGTSRVNVYGFLYAKHPAPYTGDNMAATGDKALAIWDKTPLYQGLSFTGTIGNLAPGKWYLRAYAHNDNPDSDAAQTASLGYGEDCTFTVPGDVIVPTAPGGLTATAKSQTQIDLAWTDNSTDETGFKIFRDGVELTPSPKVGANVTAFSDTGLTCGTTYTYVVKAMNADGDSAATPAVTVTTPACTVTVPAAPSGLSGVAKSATQVDLSWTDNSSNETGFRIFRNGVELLPSPKGGVNLTTFSDTGLTCGTTYSYEVRAVNASGDSAGTTVTVTTPACASGSPSAPGGLTGVAKSATQIDLSWTDNSSNETGFRIFRNGAELLPSPKTGAGVTTFSDTGLTCGTTYTYEVKAVNASGDSAGITVTVTTPACASGAPAAPGGLTATAVSQTQINLAWTDNSDNETGFRIFRNGVELLPSPKAGADVKTFSDTGLTCGMTYTYTVKATNAAGDSAGVTASATAQACPYVPPSYDTGSSYVPPTVNQAPVADTLYVSTVMNKAIAVILSGADPGSDFFTLLTKPLTYSAVTQPLHGTLTGTAPNLIYTPDQNFVGTDSFTYRAYDGTAYSAPAPVQIIVHQNSHANIGDKYEIDIFCAEYEGAKYGFRLNLTPVAADPAGYYWKGDLLTFGKAYSDSNTKGCISVVKGFQLNVPTAVYRGTMYQFTLNFTPVTADPFGFYWKMDLGTLKTH